MAEGQAEKFQVPWAAVIAAITALGGVAWYFAPLSTSRPQGVPGLVQPSYPGYQNIDARLWQDPLEPAITQAAAEAKAAAECCDSQSKKTSVSPDPRREPKNVLLQHPVGTTQIMAVMLESGPYSDAAEARRRSRNAVVSALHRANYVPEDSDHIGFIVTEKLRAPKKDPNRAAGSGSAIVPFEWFRRESSLTDFVLALWLDEGVFSAKPTSQLNQLMNELNLKKSDTPPQEILVIGPRISTTLQAMVNEVADPAIAARPYPWKFSFFCGTATAPDAFINHRFGYRQASVSNVLHAKDLELTRTTTNDYDLARALIAELMRRGVDVCGQEPIDGKRERSGDLVAVVAEWDSFYGRMLPLAFEAAARGYKWEQLPEVLDHHAKGEPLSRTHQVNIKRFNYLRGIDGKLPGQSDKSSDEQSPAKSPQDRKQAQAIAEAPEGPDQYDYLRRLTDELVKVDQQDRAAQRSWLSEGGLKAVGVLGSDVYDKLLIMQAIRAHFPHVVFFTTSLDARLGASTEWKWAHNLVIASSYGLELKPSLQTEIPPFRDGYQTATYCATLRALKCKFSGVEPADFFVRDLAQEPISLFEIGRDGWHDLGRERSSDNPVGADTIMPEPDREIGWTAKRAAQISLAVFFLALFAVVIGSHCGTKIKPLWRRLWAAAGYALLCCVYVALLIRWESGLAQISTWKSITFNWLMVWGGFLLACAAARIVDKSVRTGLPPWQRWAWCGFFTLLCALALPLGEFTLVLPAVLGALPWTLVLWGRLESKRAALDGWQFVGPYVFAVVMLSVVGAWLDHPLGQLARSLLHSLVLLVAVVVPVAVTALFVLQIARPKQERLARYVVASLLLAALLCWLAQWGKPLSGSAIRAAMIALPVAFFAAIFSAKIVDEYRHPVSAEAYPLDLRPYLVLAGLIAIAVTACVGINIDSDQGVPFAWAQGISLWPSEIIRGIAIFLAAHFLLHGRWKLNKVLSKLESTQEPEGFGLEHAPRGTRENYVVAACVWDDYCAERDTRSQRRRIALMLLIYVLFAFIIVAILGLPRAPIRGTFSMVVDSLAMGFGVLLFLGLIFYVADETMAARRLIVRLTEKATSWPPDLVRRCAAERRIKHPDVEDLLDIRFIGKLTRPIMNLVYYPFIILMLMILARLDLFADWDWPWSIILIFTMNSVLAVLSASLLRVAAERARRDTLRRLEGTRISLSGSGQDARMEKIKSVIAEIRGLREGAFASFAQNPVIGALLLPASAALLAWLGSVMHAAGN